MRCEQIADNVEHSDGAEIVVDFYSPEFGAPAYFPVTRAECIKLEWIQRLVTRMIPGLDTLPYFERCRELNLFTLEYRRTRMDLIFTFRIVCLKHHAE